MKAAIILSLIHIWKSFYALKRSGGIENPRPPRFKQESIPITYMQMGIVHELSLIHILLRFRMHCHRQFHQEIRQLLRQLPLHHRNRQRNLLQYRSRETNRFTKTEPIQEPVKDTVGQLDVYKRQNLQ